MRILVLLYSKPRKTELDKINVRWLTTKNTSKPIFERVWSAVFNEASKLIWSYIIVNNWQVYTIITGTNDEDYKRTFHVSILQLYHKPCLNTIPQTCLNTILIYTIVMRNVILIFVESKFQSLTETYFSENILYEVVKPTNN